MALPLQQAKAVFTKIYTQAYKEIITVPSFFQTMFTVKTYATKTIGLEVQRGTERIAADILRGVDGQRNEFSKHSEKQFVPPYYNEYFDATSLDRYDVAFGQGESVAPKTIGYLANDVADKIHVLRNKIERAKEYQCSQVLNTGIVTLVNGTNIDFKRKAASLKDNSAAPWSTTTSPIEAQLIAGGDFLRQKGKNTSKELNLTIAGSAWVNLKENDYFTTTAGFNQVKLLDINMPQADSHGAVYNGQISAGAYIINIWVYDEGYENSSLTWTRYFPENKAILTPVRGTRFELAHAGVPAIMADKGKAEYSQYIAQIEAEYYLNNYIDPKRKVHIFELSSAPLAIPVTVDMIYTMQIEA